MQLENDVYYSRAFQALAEESKDLYYPLQDVGELLKESTAEQFDTEGTYGGNRWQELSPAYRAYKQSRWPGKAIMQRDGALRDSLVNHGVLYVDHRRMVFGVAGDPAKYAAAHQFGRGHMPKREFLVLPREARRQIDRIFVEWLSIGRSKAGL